MPPGSLRDQLQITLGNAITLDRELGGAGMSHVYVATENALGRQIVVKVLPEQAAAAVSSERFKREIHLAARLQHPHIVPVLTAGESNGLPFYTMPYVKGESLRARLSKSGELSVNETMHVLRDIASALAYAHGEGVVHRDIKPENVILSGGVAVVTDFGIAKAMDLSVSDGGSLTGGLTSLGVALGTPAYMAPEQATADPHVDHRADIYSFGCVAYEMLAGSSPFAGRPMQQILAAHVTETPEPLARRRATAPPALAELVMSCLAKRPGDRPQSANELITSLDAIVTPSGGTTPTSARLRAVPARRVPVPVVLTAGALLALGIAAFVVSKQRSSFTPLQVGPTTPIGVTPELEGHPAISPDGKLVAYYMMTPAGTRIFVRQIDGGRPNLLSGEIDGNHEYPKWSPDGSRISFTAKGAIYVVAALGGVPKRTIEGGMTHAWSPDGKQIAFEANEGVKVHTLSDGTERLVIKGAFVHSPSWSPNGTHIAFAEGRRPTMGNVSTNVVWVAPVSNDTRVRVSDSTQINTSPVFTPDGKSLLFISSAGGIRDVYQQPVDGDGRPIGARRRLTTGLSAFTISLSADGTRMAYDIVRNFANIWMVPIRPDAPSTFADAVQVTRDNQHVEALDVSHDGKWIAFDSDRGGNADIYKLRLDGGDPVQLTTSPSNEFRPVWSPDDAQISFHSQRSGIRHIYVTSSDGGAESQVTTGAAHDYNRAWSPDGRSLSFATVDDKGDRSYRAHVVTRAANGTWSPHPIGSDSDHFGVGASIWSPDGSSIVFTVDGNLLTVRAPGEAARTLATTAALGGGAMELAWRDPSTILVSTAGVDRGIVAIMAVSPSSGTVRMLLAADARHNFGRQEISTDGKRLFFTLAAWESDVGVMELLRGQ